MHYVISDIHGCYDQYVNLISKINLKPDDTLYILGDVVDRGPEPMKVLLNMSERANVIPLMGNKPACIRIIIPCPHIVVSCFPVI